MDSLMREAGLCGRYQVIHVIFTQLPRFMSMWSLFFMMFGGFDPGWRCVIGDLSNNISGYSNTSIPTAPTLSFDLLHSSPETDASSVPPRHGVGLHSFDTNSSIKDDGVYNGTCNTKKWCEDIEFNPASRTIVTEFKTICDKSWIITAILFTQGMGYLFGPLIGGQVGEKYGRKVVLYGSTFIMCLANVLAIFSNHWLMFAACYFFIGASGNSIFGMAAVYTMEFLNAKWRGYLGSLPISNVAMCIFTFITAALKDWVYVHIFASCVSCLACFGFFVAAKSPRWLLVNGYTEQAKKSIAKIAKVNRKTINIENDLFIVNEENVQNSSYTFLHLFRNLETRRDIVKFVIIFFVMDGIYIPVSFGIRYLPGDYYMNAIEALCTEMAMVLLVGPLCNILGRRFSGLLFACIGCVSSLSIVLILVLTETMHSQATALKIFTYAAKSSSQCMCLLGAIFAVEQFPTAVRSVAMGVLLFSNALSALVAPFLVPEKQVESSIRSFAVMCTFYLVYAILFPSFPETKSRSLRDDLRTKEVDDASDGIEENSEQM